MDVHNRETQSRPRLAITVKRKDGLVMRCSLRELTGLRCVDASPEKEEEGGQEVEPAVTKKWTLCSAKTFP